MVFDRIPPGGSRMASDPLHADRPRTFDLQPAGDPWTRDYVADGEIDGTDAAARVSKDVSSQSATDESGVLHMAGGAASGDISYALAFKPGAAKRDPKVSKTSPGFEFRGWLPTPGTGPPAAKTGPGASNGELTLSLAGPAGAFTSLKSVRDGTGNNAMTAQRKWIADCLLARKYIDQAQHTTLNELAEGGQAIEAVDLGLDEAAVDALLSGQFETFAALIVNAWEAQLTAYLKEAAKKDPTNPFFKGKTEAEINGAVFEICRRPTRRRSRETEDPPDETDKTHTAAAPEGEDPATHPPSRSRSSTPRTRTTRSARRASAPATSSPRAARCPTSSCSRTSPTRAPLRTRS